MKLVEIRGEAEFRGLRPAWDALLEASGGNVFQSWEWAAGWWSSYGNPGDLRILTAWDESGVLRGIAPLRAGTLHRYGQTVPSMAFVADGSNDSDYLDLILAPGYEERVMDVFRPDLAERLKGGTVLRLNEIPATSPSLPLLKVLAGREGAPWVESEVPCGTVRLPESWDEYLGQLKPRFRTKVRSVLRQLEGSRQVRFGFCDSPEEIERLLPHLFDLHTRRWAKEGKPGVFGWDQKRRFYHAVSPLLLERGWLGLSWLEWNGCLLACQYGCLRGGVYYQLQEGYEPAAEHLNLGIGLRAWSIRELLGRGVREYDFLGGMKRNKTDWGAEIKYSKLIAIAGRGWKSRLVTSGPEWEQRARERVRKMLPEKLLALRTRMIQERAADRAPAGERLRSLAANAYFYSGLPAVLGPLRNRYQLSISTNGSGRKIAWEKRTQPAARILYYHRVNDEADPFFPAISTALFEAQVRHVARHYKVLSVSRLLDRLQAGSPEPALAITFDDGYEDNARIAAPILERYGVPAAVFLTTGSIDSREPLWFEQLADAIKRTEREYVDLEIGFPRRFWLRSVKERLEANGGIFALLRGMPNRERKQWLAEILRQIPVRDEGSRKNRMLTWDQVRQMKKQGIDFGGHTVTHPFISKLSRDEVAWEVSECKRRIEAELQSPVDYFAYPNGREEDFGDWNKDVLREAGYRAAMTTIWGVNYSSTDPMALRRGGPWEQSAAMFAYKLDWYQLANN